MGKTIAIIGALDTKGVEFAFLKAQIEKLGCRALVINVGVLGEPLFSPDIGADAVAEAGGATLVDLRKRRNRGQALDRMSQGAATVVRKLYDEKRIDGIISMGGGGGTAVGTSAMRVLPIDIPKLMVSTVASGDTSPYVGTTNITMMPSIVDVSGVNRISRRIFTNAAAAICGMVTGEVESGQDDKPLIAASMFGNTTRSVDNARRVMEAQGYEVLVFHATGTGGKTLEMLIGDGYFAGVLDVTTTEWADEVCGGVLSAGPTRLETAAREGIPQVIVPGCIDMCNFWAPETVPTRHKDRKFYHWNPNVTLMRTTPEENRLMGEIFADKINSARGPVAVFIPMRGYSEIDAPGQPFWWPEADRAFVDAFKAKIRPDIQVIETDENINDTDFSARVAEKLLEMLKEKSEYGYSA